MRIHKQFFKSTALTALLISGFTAGAFSQVTETIVNPDAKAPVILSTSPTGGEANVDLVRAIQITFSSHMDETTINGSTLLLNVTYPDTMNEEGSERLNNQIRDRSVFNDSDNNRRTITGAVSGTISYSDKVAVFTPDSEFEQNAEYTFTVTGGVKSSENIALENDHNWSFTTAVTGGPTYSDKQNNKYGSERNMHPERSMNANQKDDSTMIDLGKAGEFVILAKDEVKNTSASRVTGHIGEGSVADSSKKEEGINKSSRQVTFVEVLEKASNQSDTISPDVTEGLADMMSAYSDASEQNGDDVTSYKNESFHSTVLTSGIHQWSDSLHIVSDITLSGDENDVWIMMVGENLTVDDNTVFALTDGARSENIFWYVEGEVNIGKDAQFEGVILSVSDITLQKGAKLNGRLFSQASINLDDNTVTEPGSISGRASSANK